jgi:hypothetical protein
MEVAVAGRIVRQHHPIRAAGLRRRHDRGDVVLERQEHVDAETVHTEQRARVGDLA